jgi:hypothetical protein
MSSNPEQSPIVPIRRQPLEALPKEFEADLRRVDARLYELAGRIAMPEGLTERTFEASRRDLPQTAPRLRVVVGPPPSSRRLLLATRRQWWGRLAMAASLTLAFVVGSVFVRHAAPPAGDQPDVHLAYFNEALAEESSDLGEGMFVTYSAVETVSSVDDVEGELRAMLADLEL